MRVTQMYSSCPGGRTVNLKTSTGIYSRQQLCHRRHRIRKQFLIRHPRRRGRQSPKTVAIATTPVRHLFIARRQQPSDAAAAPPPPLLGKAAATLSPCLVRLASFHAELRSRWFDPRATTVVVVVAWIFRRFAPEFVSTSVEPSAIGQMTGLRSAGVITVIRLTGSLSPRQRRYPL